MASPFILQPANAACKLTRTAVNKSLTQQSTTNEHPIAKRLGQSETDGVQAEHVAHSC